MVSEAKARAKQDTELVFSLMKEFGIDPTDNDALLWLSVILARKLYPNGLKHVGRPRKPRSINDLLLNRHKPGRPVTKRKLRALLLEAVEAIKLEHDLKGRGSDKKALEIIVHKVARDEKRSTLAAREEYLKAWQKDLSRARSLNRKNN